MKYCPINLQLVQIASKNKHVQKRNDRHKEALNNKILWIFAKDHLQQLKLGASLSLLGTFGYAFPTLQNLSNC